MIADSRKKSLKDLAIAISESFHTRSVTDLHSVAASEDISIHYDNYEDTFDGILFYDDGEFHIHINLDRGNTVDSKKGRFSLAHELGHYFIDEHRMGLMSGEIAPHGSLNDLSPQTNIEEEADYFASCLLMPDSLFRNVKTPRKFSLDTIVQLSEIFQASVLSTAIKFAEIGTHEICAVLSENNIVKWSARSNDFPKWVNRFKRGNSLPPKTVAGEFYADANNRFTTVENVDPNNWFEASFNADREMYEQCYYSDTYRYVLSILWFD